MLLFSGFTHRLELSLKDSLKDFINSLEQALISLFYLYKKSNKRWHELKLLASVLKEIYIFENNLIPPEKVLGTRHIDHKMSAMGKLNDKFGVYATHLGNVIADTTNNMIASHFRVNKLTEADILLHSAFLSDFYFPSR